MALKETMMAYRYEMSPSVGEQSSSLAVLASTGILGFVLGACVTFMVMQPIGTEQSKDANFSQQLAAQTPTDVMGGDSIAASQMSAADLNLRGRGGRGSRGAKRFLATLVGKLELLSRPDLRVEFEAEQAKAIADRLEQLNKAESMYGDEAEEFFYSIERLLTSEQKAIIAEIALPIDVGFGPVMNGSELATGVSVSSNTSVSGMTTTGGARRDESPFTREVNQKRLRDLLNRLSRSRPEVVEQSK
jgi:hypothetical protein